MAKRSGRKLFVPVKVNGFWSRFLRVIGDISLVVSFLFIFIGLGQAGFDLFSSAEFWTVINSFWLFAILLFYFSERLKR